MKEIHVRLVIAGSLVIAGIVACVITAFISWNVGVEAQREQAVNGVYDTLDEYYCHAGSSPEIYEDWTFVCIDDTLE